MQVHIITTNESETEELGRRLGQLLEPGDVVALVGNLGAGKTCLARGIAQGLGIDEPVTSPTFILVAQYTSSRGFTLYHADCYRLAQPATEAVDIGLDELLNGEGVCVVEWAERIQDLLPQDHLLITMTAPTPESRHLLLQATGSRSAAITQSLERYSLWARDSGQARSL